MVIEDGLRKKMVEELIKEIRGPRFGANEAISFDPWSEYISGLVIPRKWDNSKAKISADNENIVEIDDGLSEDSTNDEVISNFSSSLLDPKSMIKSFGLSFYMDIPNPELNICATWGRYFKDNESEKVFEIDGSEIKNKNDSDSWKRYSFGEIIRIKIDEEELEEDESTDINDSKEDELIIEKSLIHFDSEKELDDVGKDNCIKIYIKRTKFDANLYIFSIYMLNYLKFEQKDEKHPNVEKCIFQPSIRIICEEELKTKHIEVLNESEKELDFLYQEKPTRALGHMCSAIWEEIDYNGKVNTEQLWPDYENMVEKNKDYEDFLKPKLRTEFVPLYPITLPNFDINEDNLDEGDLNELIFLKENLEAEGMANKSPKEIFESLSRLPKLYDKWIEENIVKKDTEVKENYKKTAEELIVKEKIASLRMKKGLELIRDNDLVYTAFCFANKTIAKQRRWNQEIQKENEESKEEIKEFKWRLFQIAFFLMNIEDIYYENSENKGTLDLLWIPTGGGKTEAYLGIMAYTMALRRLKSYQNHETGAGTSIISRYTLRLLTVQQFRRTLKMVTAAEFLRVDKSSKSIGWRPKYSKVKGDWIYGSTRFSTGLWVGGGVSPIHLIKEDGAMDLLKEHETNSPYSLGEPAQILKCPVCGSWLSVPKTGLNDKINKIHIVIDKGITSEIDVKKEIEDEFENHKQIKFKGITSKNHKKGYCTLSFVLEGKITKENYKEYLAKPLEEMGYKIASLSPSNIGYFSSLNKIEGKRNDYEEDVDFEIWCTNPKCKLNTIEWIEGCPYPNSDKPEFPDGNYKREFLSPFKENSRMPIPAYLIDDQVYNRCPTVIISTADKIARLSFEPKASAIFGNVNNFNKYFGYNRDGMFPKFPNGLRIEMKKYNEKVKPLKAPDLIIQDELHLIDGPLGSLFGLYEAMVSAVIEKQGGKPKYIASTATISNAEKQVDLLFSKKLFQFPPHGLDISDNFFVTEYKDEEAWDENKPGRLYLGLYAPGRGPLTPKIRIWSRMAKVAKDRKDDPKHKNFWTVVGYYNAIRELGGALALYRDDIKNRLDVICQEEKYRPLNEENKEELSSRIDSTDLPIILDELERDGENDTPKYDAILTTSMFGTGVDISHLSLMIMTGQPKTTGSYIQATGRIGRETGGLVVDFLKAGKPRDLNHYEMFPSYHSRIYLDVEPISVSPFSKGCLLRGLGPSIVAFLRNSADLEVNWQENDGKPIRNIKAKEDVNFIYNYLKDRLNNMKQFKGEEEIIKPILDYLEECIDDWEGVAESLSDDRLKLQMYEYYYYKPQQHVVLGDSGHKNDNKLKVVYNNAPQSLRDVEETIDFWV